MRRASNADELESLYFELINSFDNESELLKAVLGDDWLDVNIKQRSKMYFSRFRLSSYERNEFYIKKMKKLKKSLEFK